MTHGRAEAEGGPASAPPVDASLAMEALERVRSSTDFRASDRRRTLLAYIVEQGLAGREDRLRAYEIALAVFGRDDSFDPQADPVVRMEVGRLRRDLEHYYLTAGQHDPLRIAIPKGQYVPVFEARAAGPEPAGPAAPPAPGEPAPEAPRAPTASRPRWWDRRTAVAAGAVALLVIVFLVVALWDGGFDRIAQTTGPAVIVQPFQALTAGEDGKLLAAGISAELVTDLTRFDMLKVFEGARPQPGQPDIPPAAADAVAFIVSGGVQEEGPRFRVMARLTDRATGQVLWSQSFDRTISPSDILDVQAELAAGIASHLAQPYGIVTSAVAERLRQGQPATMFAYNCVQRAFAYRRAFAKDLYRPVRGCLEESVRRDPDYADAWAMLAFAHLDAARWALVAPEAAPGELAEGLDDARRAVALAPDRVRAQAALAALLFANGRYAEAEKAQRRAIALNPDDPESLAQLGWRLAVRGRWQEGRTYLEAAIDRTVRPPGWYHATLAVALYLDGAPDQAQREARLGGDLCCGVGQAILAISEAAAGDTGGARLALGHALRQAPILARDPRAFWATYQVSDDVIDRLVAGLRKAGLAVAALPEGSSAAVLR